MVVSYTKRLIAAWLALTGRASLLRVTTVVPGDVPMISTRWYYGTQVESSVTPYDAALDPREH